MWEIKLSKGYTRNEIQRCNNKTFNNYHNPNTMSATVFKSIYLKYMSMSFHKHKSVFIS